MRKLFIIVILVFIVAVFFNRVRINLPAMLRTALQAGNFYFEHTKEEVPLAVKFDLQLDEMVKQKQESNELPTEYNLAVPFMVQAPTANWSLPYQEACEEAVIIMLHYYMQNKSLSIELANEEILNLVSWQNDYFGDYKDTTVIETAEIMKEYWGYEVEIINNPTVQIIKSQIASGHPVIAPFYGRALANPYYSGEGPLYHMMVIKGYTDNKFITNDPGTKRGKDYVYDYATIMSAIHDWNGGDVQNGQVVVFVVK